MTLPESATSKIGKKGVVVIPAKLRRRYGLEEGSLVIAEETPEGILIRPAVAMPVEIYSPERRAEFLLSNAESTQRNKSAKGKRNSAKEHVCVTVA